MCFSPADRTSILARTVLLLAAIPPAPAQDGAEVLLRVGEEQGRAIAAYEATVIRWCPSCDRPDPRGPAPRFRFDATTCEGGLLRVRVAEPGAYALWVEAPGLAPARASSSRGRHRHASAHRERRSTSRSRAGCAFSANS